jgi:serine/threonine-protein kinase
MIYHLMCGEPPFGSGLRAVKTILAAEKPVPPPFLTSNPQFAPLATKIMELVYSCLQRDPDARPTADDLVNSCGDLCYSPAPRREGRIRRIEHNKWGFISTIAGDVFFHKNSSYGPDQLQLNDQVLFSSFDGGGSDRAHPVVKLS